MFQLSDSAFPAGGFSHSGGLEAVVQQGWTGDAQSIEALLREQIGQAAFTTAAFVSAGHRQSDRLAEHDRKCGAILSNHVANRASRAMGRAFLLAVSRIFVQPGIARIVEESRRDGFAGHFGPLFGAACGELGIDLIPTVRLYLFLTLRGLVSSAVRLGIVGPLEGQAIQCRLSLFAESLVERVLEMSVDDAVQTAPLLDLVHGSHDRLYSRLFQS